MDYSPFVDDLLPDDLDSAHIVARLQAQGERGFRVVTARHGRFVDLTRTISTVSELIDRPDLLDIVRETAIDESWSVDEVVRATLSGDDTAPRLVSPIDLQVIKAAGVTFAKSMIERVIEERAGGEADRAAQIRARVGGAIGDAIETLRPGSREAEEVKRVLIAEGLWSAYLEVGIGPDPEIFTKAPVLSSVGTASDVGVLRRSRWNNPEPEVALAVTSAGLPVGAMLGNDVNLRDFEGRSALLLGEAKDNNGSCALGPVIRLFDDDFTLDTVRSLRISLRVTGDDGFELDDDSSMSQMSRTLEELVESTIGAHHQYPDGVVLLTGTAFAPTQDRDADGKGFTHHLGDVVRISTPLLGTLVNRVRAAEDLEPWTLGIRQFFADLADKDRKAGSWVS